MSFDADVQANTTIKILEIAGQSDARTANRLIEDVHDTLCKLSPDEQGQTIQALEKTKLEVKHHSIGLMGTSTTIEEQPTIETLKDGHGATTAFIFHPKAWPLVVSTDCPKQQ